MHATNGLDALPGYLQVHLRRLFYLFPDLDRSAPWISRLTFAAQALDLPNGLNENGFVMFGSLAWPVRPCITFLSVASQV